MKKKSTYLNISPLLVALIFLFAGMLPARMTAANNDEKIVEKTVSISNFHYISASTGIQVKYTQKAFDGKAHISATEKAMKYLKVEVKNGELKIYYDFNSNKLINNLNSPTVVTVGSPVLKEVHLSSAAKFISSGKIVMKGDLEAHLSSAAEMNIPYLECKEFEAHLSSAADLKLDKFQGDIDLELSSASSAKINEISGSEMEISTSSAATASVKKFTGRGADLEASSGSGIKVGTINSTKLSASASSGANISVSGKATNISTSTSSGGTVNASGLAGNNIKKNSDQKNYSTDFTYTYNSLSDSSDQLKVQKADLEARKKAFAEQKKAFEEQKKAFAEQKKAFEKQKKALEKQKSNKKIVVSNGKNSEAVVKIP